MESEKNERLRVFVGDFFSFSQIECAQQHQQALAASSAADAAAEGSLLLLLEPFE